MKTSLFQKIGIALFASAALATPMTAQAAPAVEETNEYIVGGEPAQNRAVVQLKFTQNGGQYGCSGSLISEEWVLTARHCTEGASNMNVFTSNSTQNPGQPVRAAQLANSPRGDVGLVRLSQPVNVGETMDITDSTVPQRGQQGTVQGYGLRANSTPSTGLFQAEVQVTGPSRDLHGGPASNLRGITGAANRGDSGGPLIINGQVVGVCSTGGSPDPGANINSGSNYSNVAAHRDWIRQTAGV